MSRGIKKENAAYRPPKVLLKAFAAQGILPQRIAADHAHAMGLRFDLMFRLGILGGICLSPGSEDHFVRRHPEFRQVLRDGTVLEKASHADGHRDERAHWEQFDPGSRLIPLTQVAGVDVAQGLADAVYSVG